MEASFECMESSETSHAFNIVYELCFKGNHVHVGSTIFRLTWILMVACHFFEPIFFCIFACGLSSKRHHIENQHINQAWVGIIFMCYPPGPVLRCFPNFMYYTGSNSFNFPSHLVPVGPQYLGLSIPTLVLHFDPQFSSLTTFKQYGIPMGCPNAYPLAHSHLTVHNAIATLLQPSHAFIFL